MSSDVEKIKERLGIVDVVESYIKVQKSGKNFKAVCPFHNEKTPSFFLSPDRGTYYCFGCGAKGDIFSFVQEFEGLDFQGALKLLAPKAGVTLSNNKGKNKELDKLYEILDEAGNFYEENLKKNKIATSYLKKRGISEETIKHFRIGSAENQWDLLLKHLISKSYKEKDIEKVGLLKKSDVKKTSYDTFRNRIMFPIFDSAGRIVAFSGRFLNDSADFEKFPKYINSPETILFNKSQILYGYDKAKSKIRKMGYAILVEGQIDLIMAHQAGFTNTIAISGTGFTIHHANLIKKITDKMIVALDADNAGISSTKRASELALSKGMDIKVVKIPTGKDPADIILENKNTWKEIISKSISVVEFFIGVSKNKSNDKRNFWKNINEIVLPLIARIQNKIDKSHFISLTSSRTGIPEEAVEEELMKIEKEMTEQKQYKTSESKDLIGLKKDYKSGGSFLKTKKQIIIERIKGIILWQKSLNEKKINIDKLIREVEQIIKEKLIFENDRDIDISKLVFEAEIILGMLDKKEISKEINELLFGLKEEILKEEYKDTVNLLKKAESEGDQEKIEKFLLRCRELSQKIKK